MSKLKDNINLLDKKATQSLNAYSMPTKPLLKVRNTSKVTSKDIAWLWLVMTMAFGYKFTQNYGEKDNGIWLEALKDLTRDDLNFGFKRMLKATTEEERRSGEAWPPNAKEFRIHCEFRLEKFQLPKLHEAFFEAKSNSYLRHPSWSHPVTAIAAKNLKKKENEYIYDCDYRNFAVIYDELCQRFMRGEALTLSHQ